MAFNPNYKIDLEVSNFINEINNLLADIAKLGGRPVKTSSNSSHSMFEEFDVMNKNDLFRYHQARVQKWCSEPGKIRSGKVMVFNKIKHTVMHEGAPQKDVDNLLTELFDWLNTTQENYLIVSAIFHYQLVTIHPFTDGNGRTSRAWLHMILAKHNSIFKFMPFEQLIKKDKVKYNQNVHLAQQQNDITPLIKYFFKIIKDWLISYKEKIIYFKDMLNKQKTDS